MAKEKISAISSVKKPKSEKSEEKALKNFGKKISKSFKSTEFVSSLIAEFIGTFLLVISFMQMQSSPLFVAFAIAGIYLIISGSKGAFLNPAVTLGAWVTKKIDAVRAIFYIVAQSFGAAAAYVVLNAFLKTAETSLTGTTLYHADTIAEGKEWYILFAELLGSVVLSLGFAAAYKIRREKAAAGLTAGLGFLVAIYISMALTTILLTAQYTSLTFLNPVVAFAANGISWNLWPILIWIIAPLVGGVIGFILQDVLATRGDEPCECEYCKK